MELLTAFFQWIGANEAVLSGIAAAIVIVGVLFTPVGRGLRAVLRRGSPAAASGAPGAPGRPVAEPPPQVTDRPSIAVLPFANPSGDAEHEYLADGLTEDVILGLSRIKQFFVIARNSSFSYKGKAADAAQVSRELGVRYVLEGSVRKLGDRVRVTAQLVDAATRSPAWSERYDRKLEEIVEVDDEVTEAIVAALQPALRRAEAERARRASPEDLTAWSLVNRAWVAVQSDLGNPAATESAIAACRDALARDPDYAFAHAVLGLAQSLLAREGAGGGLGEAEASVRRALELDSDDPLVHHCHAALLGNLGRTAEGVRAWERAIELDPNSAGARAGLGIARIYLGEPEPALADIDAALRRSPRDPILYHWLAHRAVALLMLGRWEPALEAAQDSVGRTGSRAGYAVLATALAHEGRLAEAREAHAALLARTPGFDLAGFQTLADGICPDPDLAKEIGGAMRRAAEAPDPT